eukprot:351698-Chlamydomonas_euryale.AAC.7
MQVRARHLALVGSLPRRPARAGARGRPWPGRRHWRCAPADGELHLPAPLGTAPGLQVQRVEGSPQVRPSCGLLAASARQ